MLCPHMLCTPLEDSALFKHCHSIIFTVATGIFSLWSGISDVVGIFARLIWSSLSGPNSRLDVDSLQCVLHENLEIVFQANVQSACWPNG